ncbi:UvrD-helicase domain-containing protein [Paraglaciecola sp. 20A4]|uniref:UvrD-helicase domain-containing protein n=1 Tax=Paraglaciecola sp. 20A4 TaxID=2687288 RepID=UPI00140AEBA7|nr:UvrD-helicase domain-containing protein [Paraglaciecola sp. 20A4]
MIPLDTKTFPLVGASLIEASAGTGKTYTIVNLYLRLLLGDECQPLSVDEILVVTFTNAATAELKQRIRQRLHSAYLDFYAGQSNDEFTQHLIERSTNIELDSHRLLLAIKQMDDASVFTIHGFCQRMLSLHAFESGAMYEQSLVLDESQWLKLAVEDYWRGHIVDIPAQILKELLNIWRGPSALQSNLRSLLYRHITPLKKVDIVTSHKSVMRYIESVHDTKRWWLDNNVAQQIIDADLKANTKLGKADFIAKMQAFCKSDSTQADFDKDLWQAFSPEKVIGAMKKTSKSLEHLDFSRFEMLARFQQQCHEALLLAYSVDALEHIAANLATNKQRLQLLSPDDLLSNLHQALIEQQNNSQIDSQEAQPNDTDGINISGSEQSLAKAIQLSYPAALIDEFQDTDPVQFDIFRIIYTQQFSEITPCWVAIGDPKQAIYAFRGADIHTYITAKALIDESHQFTLGTNWRSQPRLVEGVNTLFSQSEAGFLFKDSIPFQAVNSVTQKSGLQIMGHIQRSLDFQHLTSENGNPLAWGEAQVAMAKQCAWRIASFIQQGTQGEAKISDRSLMAGDCCVLVRDRNEANTIKQALAELGVDSMFLARKSVFASQTAIDLFSIVQALANPSNDRYLRAAISSELFCYDAQALDQLFSEEWHWQKLVEQFAYWHQLWQRHGLMMALNILLRHFDIAQRLVAQYRDGQRRLTDLRHLIELLQVQSQLMSGESQILHWFQEHLAEPDNDNEGQQIRLETEQDLVQIITQHTSKGLEYPLVFIPFATRCREMKEAIYHSDKEGLVIDFLGADVNLALADHERLAEDIRLLYVALTRAVHYCFVGLWNNAHPQRKKESQLMQTALGRVLFNQGTQINDTIIAKRLNDLSHDIDVGYHAFNSANAEQAANDFKSVLQTQNAKNSQTGMLPRLKAAHLSRSITRRWRLTSYSAISSQQHHEFLSPGLDEGSDKIDLTSAIAKQTIVSQSVSDALTPALSTDVSSQNESLSQTTTSLSTSASVDDSDMLSDAQTYLVDADEVDRAIENIDEQEVLDQFTFVKGAQAGSFLHGVLESIDFTDPVDLSTVITQKGIWYGIDEKWFSVVEQWIRDVLQAKLTTQTGNALCLAVLNKQQILVEMEFHLPLVDVQAKTFNHILNQHIHERKHHYQFEQLNGMLKGFIDLIIQYEGKFYVLDYKSNYLGGEYSDYNGEAMANAMQEHDYYLQAILYTLALHRWLKNKWPDYDFTRDMGGAYYTFLRGMHSDNPGNGVFYIKPSQALIEDLDALFSGRYGERDDSESRASDSVKMGDEKVTDVNHHNSGSDRDDPMEQGQLDLW